MAYPYYPSFNPNYYNQQQNILPPQQVLQANGQASVSAIKMAPNSSALVMDTTAPLVWLCTSDSLGNVTTQAYDITPHREAQNASDIESRLSAVEKNVNTILAKWEGLKNESDVSANANAAD